MDDFWINGIGGIIITVLSFVVGLSFRKDHPIVATIFIIFAFCWVFFPLFSVEPTYVTHGCIVTVEYDDDFGWVKSLLIICIPLMSFIISARRRGLFLDDTSNNKTGATDDFDDGL